MRSAGIVAIPYAIILVPAALFVSIQMATEMIVGFMLVLGITGKIVAAIILILFIWGVFALVRMWQRIDV